MVECFLAKEDVAGSTPVSRSNCLFWRYTSPTIQLAATMATGRARYPSGKGEVCKTFMRRFNPDPRLHTFSNLPKIEQSAPKIVGNIVGTLSFWLRPSK